VNGIFYNNKTKDKDPYTNRLLRSAEQRMNIVYMLIMAAFEAQRLEKLITEETDIPVRTIVTETGITRIS
jgi:5-formyltetrahydrofolate cyclo-ligase